MAHSPACLGGLRQKSQPAESVDFQDDLGSDNAALQPTLGIACGKTNSSNRASPPHRACDDWLRAAHSSQGLHFKGVTSTPMQTCVCRHM